MPYPLKDFPPDNGGEGLNWALYQPLTGGRAKLPWTRRRAHRKHANAPCEQKHGTQVRQRFGPERFAHPELVALLDDLSAHEWSQFTHHFKPTFKRRKREKQDGKPKRRYETTPKTPYQRLLESPDIPRDDESPAAGRTRAAGSVRVEENH